MHDCRTNAGARTHAVWSTSLRARCALLCADRRGTSYVEYLVLLAFVALALIGALRTLGGQVGDVTDRGAQAVASLTVMPPGESGPAGSDPSTPAASGSPHGGDPRGAGPSGADPEPGREGTRADGQPPRDGQEREPCKGFWECFKERTRDGIDPLEEWLGYQKNLWGAAWEDISSTFSDTWDLAKTLFTDPVSLWNQTVDSAEAFVDDPIGSAQQVLGDLWEQHVWDDKSTELWNQGDYWGLAGRQVWKIAGQHATYFIPGPGWAKAGLDVVKIFDKVLDVGRKVDPPGRGGDGGDRKPGSETPEGGEPPPHRQGGDDDQDGAIDESCVGDACQHQGGPCFVAGTLVHTESGLRPIESVSVDDRVWSRDADTGEVALRPVTRRFVTPDQPIVEVQLEQEGGEPQVLRATPEHPFWTRERGWVGAGQLIAGETVLQRSGGWLRVGSATWTRERATVFNFEVAGFHTYFVGDAGAWVHNKCEPPRPGGDPNAPTRQPGEPLNASGRTPEQEAYFRNRIDNAPDAQSAAQARYDRHVATAQNRGDEPLSPEDWKAKFDTVTENRQRGNELEGQALDDLGVTNNNGNTDRNGNPRTPTTYDVGDGTATRPDAVTDRAVVDIKSVPDDLTPDGEPRTVYRTSQLDAQQAGARRDGKAHVTVITNANRDVARPSGPLAGDQGSDAVLHRNSATGQWSQWNPTKNDGRGGWDDITNDEARQIVGEG